MWHAMFVEQIPFTEKILRTVLVYALIAVLFRLSGKRGLANLSTFDFVVIFLLSNVVQNAVIGNDTSLTGGVVGAVTLVVVNAVVNRVVASNALAARIFDGLADHGDPGRAGDPAGPGAPGRAAQRTRSRGAHAERGRRQRDPGRGPRARRAARADPEER